MLEAIRFRRSGAVMGSQPVGVSPGDPATCVGLHRQEAKAVASEPRLRPESLAMKARGIVVPSSSARLDEPGTIPIRLIAR